MLLRAPFALDKERFCRCSSMVQVPVVWVGQGERGGSSEGGGE